MRITSITKHRSSAWRTPIRNLATSALLFLAGTSLAQIPSTTGNEKLNIGLLGTYATGVFDGGAAEIPAFDAKTKRLFVVNAIGSVDVLDIKNPTKPTKLFSIDILGITGGTPNSVDVKEGIVAVAVEKKDAQGNHIPGLVAFFSANLPKAPTKAKKTVEVGALPDMLLFTPDGTKILVANEGEPGESLDPEGSISVVDISKGIDAATATTVRFTAFDGKENELRAKGVRIFPGKKASEDFEPEYIAVSPDGLTAFVTLQEANAFAVLDIAKGTFRDILPLGYKDHSRGPASLKQYTFNEPAIGKKLNGEDILFGGLSGLYFEKESNGKYTFVTVPDRGPNGDESPVGRPFLKPDYVAEVIRFELDKATGKLTILEKIPLKRKEGATIKAITGFPNIPGVDEKPIDEAGNSLPYDPFGADLEGIVVAGDGSFWMVDEYRPSIYHFSKEGMLLHRYVPKGTAAKAGQPEGTYGEETLPAEYGTRRSNRGFEAMALDAQSGILYAFIQTPLANPNRTASDNSSVIRMLGIDPATGKPVAEYLYMLEKPAFRATNVDKMGDAAYDPQTKTFYVIERDDNATSVNKKYVFRFDLKGATNLLSPDVLAIPNDKTLEERTPDELVALGIKPVHKTKVLNLPSLGYLPSDKPEGLTLLPDGSLAVLNDNDFGLGGPALSTVGLGIISFEAGNTLDASDRDEKINLRNWPIQGMFMPDAVKALAVGGLTYYITANEGDTRDEPVRVKDVKLDPTAFPDASVQDNKKLGRLNISSIDGDTDGDGDFDQLYTYGARSFSVWDQYGNLVYDSGDELEKITAARYPAFFNSTNTENNFDNRSDDKGPEPEGVTTGIINGRTYAFIGLERIGGFMIYDVSQPEKPVFVEYVNNRNFEGDAEGGTAGDLGPEGLVFIDAKDSPTNSPLLVVSNEISGTTSIFSINEKQAVESFVLVNADTDRDIRPLKEGDVIDLASLPTMNLNIRANTSPGKVGSVIFDLNGKQTVENNLPYALAGGAGTNYNAWTLPVGEHTLTATPYSDRNPYVGTSTSGVGGTALTIHFKVIGIAVTSLVLVDADTDKDIQTLKNGAVIDLAAMPSQNLNIRAVTNPAKLGSVVFHLNGSLIRENHFPYAIGGDINGDFRPWTLPIGHQTLLATPYEKMGAGGKKGVVHTVKFAVVNSTAPARLTQKDKAGNTARMEARPNPFTDRTSLRFSVPETGYTTVEVFDTKGTFITQVYSATVNAGEIQTLVVERKGWKAGIYVVRISSPQHTAAYKLVLTE